jgi:outer membrane protein
MRFFAGAATIAAALVLSAAGASAQTAALKLGYINSHDILQAAPGRAEAEAQFQKELQGYQAQITRMGDSLNTMVADYTKAEATLSPAAKATRQKNIRAKQDEYQGRQTKLQEQMQSREQELVQPILDQVRKVIDDLRTEGSYTMIFDVAAGEAQGVSFIVSYDKNLDLSQQVIARLKTTTAAKPTPGAPLASPAGVGGRPKTP